MVACLHAKMSHDEDLFGQDRGRVTTGPACRVGMAMGKFGEVFGVKRWIEKPAGGELSDGGADLVILLPGSTHPRVPRSVKEDLCSRSILLETRVCRSSIFPSQRLGSSSTAISHDLLAN